MDVAKAVGVLARYGGSITEYEGAHLVPGPIEPIIAIPTTAGTGSEVTAFSVITDTSRNYKLTVFSYELLPKYALLDPEMIMSVPASVAASCGIDACICVGKLCKYMAEKAQAAETGLKVIYVPDRETLLADLNQYVEKGDTILVKASHFMKFEEVVAKLQEM